MDKERLIKLTNKLYRLTLLFPKREPLRYKMRQKGIELLADITSWSGADFSESSKSIIASIEKGFDVLKNFFQVAKEQNWVKKEEISELEQEYEGLKEEIISAPSRPKTQPVPQEREEFQFREEKEFTKPPPLKVEEKPVISLPPFGLEKFPELDKRQKEVLKFLQEKKEIQIGELSKNFPQVSRRTLLRDLEKLSQLGFVIRKGDGRGVFYRFQLKKTFQEM